MLKLLFSWLDARPWVYWAVVAVPTALLLANTLRRVWSHRAAARRWGDEIGFVLLAIATLFAWRWPFLFEARELNLDEGQLIAGARTLAVDPVFWRSVDGMTSGPLNYAVLLPWYWLGLPLDYFAARFVGLSLIAAGLVALYALLRRQGGTSSARLALLPPLLFFATTTDHDFVHFSSEHLSFALFGIAAFLLFAEREDVRVERRSTFLGLAIAGLLPWAKLQFGPLAAWLVAAKLTFAWQDSTEPLDRKLGRAAWLSAVALAPTAVSLVVIGATGQFREFVQSYFTQNFVYVGQGAPIAKVLASLARSTAATGAFLAFVGGALLCIVARGWAGAPSGSRRRLLWVGAGGTVLAVLSVLAPGRPFMHYLLLCVAPITLWLGAALRDERILAARWLGLGAVALLGLAPLLVRLRQPAPSPYGRLAECWRHPHRTPGAILRAIASPSDSVAIWGWQPDVFVDSGLPQGTRDGHTAWAIWGQPTHRFYRARFLDDLRRNRPTFFVDAVGPACAYFRDREASAHERVPELKEYIDREYVLLIDVGSERIYVRRGSPLTASRALAGTDSAERTGVISLGASPRPDFVQLSEPTVTDLQGKPAVSTKLPAKFVFVLHRQPHHLDLELLAAAPTVLGSTEPAPGTFRVEAAVFPLDAPPQRLFHQRIERGDAHVHIAIPESATSGLMVIRAEGASESIAPRVTIKQLTLE